MAQTEDTELRDIVLDALEKNGSLAKIRALLRANIFLAFEEECEQLRHNARLDGVAAAAGGRLALALVHDFLESCNLKNTLFVYRAEARAPAGPGRRALCAELSLQPRAEQPALLALVQSVAGAGPPTPRASDSTSYAHLRPYSSADDKAPEEGSAPVTRSERSASESSKSATLSGVPSLSANNERRREHPAERSSRELSHKSEGDLADYSYDFSSSQELEKKEAEGRAARSPGADGSPQRSSHSSVSASDVAELLGSSPERLSLPRSARSHSKLESALKISPRLSNRLNSDDSGDYSSSPVPSLSNLSLDVHSD